MDENDCFMEDIVDSIDVKWVLASQKAFRDPFLRILIDIIVKHTVEQHHGTQSMQYAVKQHQQLLNSNSTGSVNSKSIRYKVQSFPA